LEQTIVYDKADYHFDSVDRFNLPYEHAYNHTLFFLRWLIQNDFLSDSFRTTSAAMLTEFDRGSKSIQELYEWWDGCLISNMLSKQGNLFTQSYFDFDHGQYINDYRNLLQNDLQTEMHILYNEANYQKLKPIIDRRYVEWKKSSKKPWWKTWKFFFVFILVDILIILLTH
jgi:hypothetical protein